MRTVECKNLTVLSKNANECSVLRDSYGIKYIVGFGRKGCPCLDCKQQWKDNKEPTKETLTSTMQSIVDTNGKVELPTIIEQAISLTKAIANYALKGFQNVPEGEKKLRIGICDNCEHLTEDRKCSFCGCPVDSKAGFSGEDCDIKKWPRLPLEIINNPPRRCGSCSH